MREGECRGVRGDSCGHKSLGNQGIWLRIGAGIFIHSCKAGIRAWVQTWVGWWFLWWEDERVPNSLLLREGMKSPFYILRGWTSLPGTSYSLGRVGAHWRCMVMNFYTRLGNNVVRFFMVITWVRLRDGVTWGHSRLEFGQLWERGCFRGASL